MALMNERAASEFLRLTLDRMSRGDFNLLEPANDPAFDSVIAMLNDKAVGVEQDRAVAVRARS